MGALVEMGKSLVYLIADGMLQGEWYFISALKGIFDRGGKAGTKALSDSIKNDLSTVAAGIRKAVKTHFGGMGANAAGQFLAGSLREVDRRSDWLARSMARLIAADVKKLRETVKIDGAEIAEGSPAVARLTVDGTNLIVASISSLKAANINTGNLVIAQLKRANQTLEGKGGKGLVVLHG
jgi:hypothetical protein